MIFSVDETLKLVMRQNDTHKIVTSRNMVQRKQKARRSPVPSISYSEAVDEDYHDVASSKLSSLTLDESIDTALESVGNSSRRSVSPEVSHRALGAETTGVENFLTMFDTIKMQADALIKKGVKGKQYSPRRTLGRAEGLLSDVRSFIDLADHLILNKRPTERTKLQRGCHNLEELTRDMLSMIVDNSKERFDGESASALMQVHSSFVELLDQVFESMEKVIGQEATLISYENSAKKLIKELYQAMSRRDFISLAESTCSFMELVRKSSKILETISDKLKLGKDAKEQMLLIKAKLSRNASEFESISKELIGDINDRTNQNLAVVKMQDVLASLVELRQLSSKHDRSSVHFKEAPAAQHLHDRTKSIIEEDAVALDANEQSSFALYLNEFYKAINNNDYRTVEVLANRLMGGIKVIGDLLQRISTTSSSKQRELRHAYGPYFKLCGSFCSQARKAALADNAEEAVDNLRKIGKEMEQNRDELMERCSAVLQPWFDISQLKDDGDKADVKAKIRTVLEVTQKMKKIVETLNSTECVENNKLSSELTKLSKIVETSAGKIINTTKGSSGSNKIDAYSMETLSLQWTCSVISLIKIIDDITAKSKASSAGMKNYELIDSTMNWVSMLQDLTVCCTDEEASREITEGIDDLESLCQNFQEQLNGERTLLQQTQDGILVKREWSAKVLLLSELIDILTLDVSEPMRVYIDPLASLSFAPSLQSYKMIKDAFIEKMDTVDTMACLAVEESPCRTEAHLVFAAVEELKKISVKILDCISSSDDAKKWDLDLLKLQWRVKATYLIKVIKSVPEVNFTAVAGVMRHLQSASHLGRLDELIDILCDDGSRGNSMITQNSWNSTRGLSPDIPDVGEHALEYDSILSSVLDYPMSRDTDQMSNTSPRNQHTTYHYFRNFESSHREDADLRLPVIQTPDTFNPQSSASSRRSSDTMSQDTEIFIGRPNRRSNFSDYERDADDTGIDRLQHHDVEALSREGGRYSPVGNRYSNGVSTKEDLLAKDDSKISKSIAAAAQILQRELEQWEEDGNSIITVVKQMSSQMLQMADYTRGKGLLRGREDFINTARAIAANAQIVAKFAVIIADHCLDETCKMNLFHYAEIVPTISTQLKIIASVKAATPDDETADTMLIGNAENLMKSVLATLRAAESASVKMKDDPNSPKRKSKSAALTLQWRRKLELQRSMESLTAPTNELGLRKLADSPVLSIADL
eukprot:Seg3333.1 transcript_id=Seg3333.1/GoldUCD/mRNA.D3Y31 product=Vinculin protein_id=Seg3333.1/GoldUCD/D3Y31